MHVRRARGHLTWQVGGQGVVVVLMHGLEFGLMDLLMDETMDELNE